MRYALGVDLGATNARAGVVTPGGEVLYSERRATEAGRGGEHVLAVLADLVGSCLSRAPLKRAEIDGIGIGSPGVIDITTGTVVKATLNIPGWSGTPLKTALESAFGTGVYVDNDANVVALGEHRFGAAKGCDDFVCVTLGSGVGGCIFVDGKIRRGRQRAAGHIGHMSVDSAGRLCNCGRVGCLEQYASAWAVGQRARARVAAGDRSLIARKAGGDPDRVDAKLVFEAAREGDPLALAIASEVARAVAQVLADIVNLLDPELIVIGGGVAQAGDDLIARIRQELETASKVGVEPPPVVPARLGEDAGILGGAALVFGGFR